MRRHQLDFPGQREGVTLEISYLSHGVLSDFGISVSTRCMVGAAFNILW